MIQNWVSSFPSRSELPCFWHVSEQSPWPNWGAMFMHFVLCTRIEPIRSHTTTTPSLQNKHDLFLKMLHSPHPRNKHSPPPWLENLQLRWVTRSCFRLLQLKNIEYIYLIVTRTDFADLSIVFDTCADILIHNGIRGPFSLIDVMIITVTGTPEQ